MCDVPGPLKEGKSVFLELEFDVSALMGGDELLDFGYLEVYSDSEDFVDLLAKNNRGKCV